MTFKNASMMSSLNLWREGPIINLNKGITIRYEYEMSWKLKIKIKDHDSWESNYFFMNSGPSSWIQWSARIGHLADLSEQMQTKSAHTTTRYQSAKQSVLRLQFNYLISWTKLSGWSLFLNGACSANITI